MKTALYGRTSKDDKARLSIDTQKNTLRGWAVNDPLVSSVAGEYWDADVSGKIPLWDRPAGRDLLAAIQTGKVEAVAVVYLDRFGRTLLDSLQAAAKIEESGVKLVAVNDGWDARRDDDPLYFHLRSAIAEAEHRRIKARFDAGKARAADRDNAPPGGSLVFGYKMGPRGEFIIDPVEAAIVRHVFGMIADGKSQTQIVAWLSSCGVSPGRRWQRRGGEAYTMAKHLGARWNRNSIQKMVSRRQYIGERRWRGRLFSCPPIIDRELWDRVQSIRGERRRIAEPGKLRGLCSGLLVCGLCGNRFHYDHNRGCRANYRCEGRTRHRICTAARRQVAEIDGRVWEAVRAFLENPEHIIREAAAICGSAEDSLAEIEQEERRIDADLDEIENAVKGLQAEQTARGLPFAWILPQLDTWNSGRVKLLAEQASLRDRRAAVHLDKDVVERVVSGLTHDIVHAAEHSTPAERRELVLSLVSAVEVGEDCLSVHFKWGGVAAIPSTNARERCSASLVVRL